MMETPNNIHRLSAVTPTVNNSVREKAMQAFSQQGWPNPKTEAYRMLPIKRLLNQHAWQEPEDFPKTDLSRFLIPNIDAHILVFVNGQYQPELSSISNQENVRIQSLADALGESGQLNHFGNILQDSNDPFAALNSALWTDGIAIQVDDNTTVDKPINILYLTDTNNLHVHFNTRLFIHLGKSAKATIIEQHESISGVSFHNYGTEIVMEASAELSFCAIQKAQKAIQVCNTTIHQKNNSKLNTFTMTLEGQLIRNNLEIKIDGEDCDSHFHGLYLTDDYTIVDNHTIVDHRKPNSFSNEIYKGVMKGSSKGIFNGKIYVRPHAQKTNAFQSNRNLLLSDTATVHTKPQLEIWADDVKCSHGSTTGQIDEEALFYLRSRGIKKDKALALLLHAFAAETFEMIELEALKLYFDRLISDKLNGESL